MKIQAQVDALETLASLDAEIAALDEEIGKEREALGQRRTEFDALGAKMGASQTSLDDMERSRGELMTEARQMSVQMERSREKLARCRTEREANAAQREIEELRKLYRDREQEVEKISSLLEQARHQLSETSSRRAVVGGEIGETEGATATKLRELESELAVKLAKRDVLVKNVQAQLFRRYELIRKRKGSSVAHVTDGTCSMCHMRIPPMMFQQLMRGDEFQQCPSCNRIIYYKPPTADGAAATGPTGA